MEKIGFLGLGAMGSVMAGNILKGGYPLAVYNRTVARTAPLQAQGASVCTTPRELAAQSDSVVIMVTGPDDLLAVLNGPDGVAAGLGPGKAVINMGTVSDKATEQAAALVQAMGADYVDAPVSGSVKPATEAALVILAGCTASMLTRVTPLLQTMGREVVHCGDIGSGTRMKLVLNLMLGSMMESLAEAIILARSFELDPSVLLQALQGGAMAAPFYQLKGKAILDGDFTRQFPLHLLFKDLNLALEAARHRHVPLPQTAAVRECFSVAMARGYGDEDIAAVVKALEAVATTLRD
jgi:3-hydroxyisobutyrate dehydrogenase-like beta-hydroxyacid dehydrogenase